ncbi:MULTISPECIES: cupin domain-containing protein [unclassified Sphingopyxis]|jgi:transcriptional regulator with XRE-family HTH domain|nr:MULTISPECIES: cupin domain-containing protein [unclassified Sphingopyxis]
MTKAQLASGKGPGRGKRTLFAHKRNVGTSDALSTPLNVGGKIREKRKLLGMTIEDISLKTGLSIGHISQIERDITSPTLNAFQLLASVLGVNISYFFSDVEEKEKEGRYITRGDDRKFLTFSSGFKECQINTSAISNLQVLCSTFEPGAAVDEPYSHDGEECGMVISGVFEITIDGEPYLLKDGDGFSFPSEKPHSYRNPGESQAVVVWAMTPPSY